MPNIALGIPALARGRESKRARYASLGVSLKTTLALLKLVFRCASAFFLGSRCSRSSFSTALASIRDFFFLMTHLHGRSRQGKVEQMFDTSTPRIEGNIFEVMRSIPHECVQKRIDEQIVDGCAPDSEGIAEVIEPPQHCISVRIADLRQGTRR